MSSVGALVLPYVGYAWYSTLVQHDSVRPHSARNASVPIWFSLTYMCVCVSTLCLCYVCLTHVSAESERRSLWVWC